MNTWPSALKNVALWPNETQQPSQTEDFQVKLMFPESQKSSSVNNQGLVTSATAEKYQLTLQLIISHIKVVGLKFPRTEMLSSFLNKVIVFTCKNVLFLSLRAILLLYNKILQCTCRSRNGRSISQIILFYIFDIRL